MKRVIDDLAEKAVKDFSDRIITINSLTCEYGISRPTASKIILRLITDGVLEMLIFPLSQEKRYRLR